MPKGPYTYSTELTLLKREYNLSCLRWSPPLFESVTFLRDGFANFWRMRSEAHADLGRAPLLVSGMVVVFRCLGFDCCDLQVTATRDRRDARRRQQRRMGRGAVQGQLDFKSSGVARQ